MLSLVRPEQDERVIVPTECIDLVQDLADLQVRPCQPALAAQSTTIRGLLLLVVTPRCEVSCDCPGQAAATKAQLQKRKRQNAWLYSPHSPPAPSAPSHRRAERGLSTERMTRSA